MGHSIDLVFTLSEVLANLTPSEVLANHLTLLQTRTVCPYDDDSSALLLTSVYQLMGALEESP